MPLLAMQFTLLAAALTAAAALIRIAQVWIDDDANTTWRNRWH
jgi:hypothetical protein